jgi:hypothetical protein
MLAAVVGMGAQALGLADATNAKAAKAKTSRQSALR